MASMYGVTVFFGEDKRLVKRGELSFKASHITCFHYDASMGVCKAMVHASMKDKEYQVELWCNEEGLITDSACSCPRGQSKCHHMAAVALYAVQNIASTSKVCSWRKSQGPKEKAAVVPPDALKPIGNLEAIIDASKNEAPCWLTWLMKPEPEQAARAPFLDVTECMALAGEPLTAHEKATIEADTRGQRDNPRWSLARRGRLTASNFGKVLKCAVAGRVPAPSLMKTLLQGYDASAASAIQWGILHEADAIKEFEAAYGVIVRPSGLWLHDSGYLGASLDGLVGSDTCVEVKCPFSARDGLLSKVREGGFYLSELDGRFILNQANDQGWLYYHQIQGGLHISGRKLCHLVVWTPATFLVVDVPVDPAWEKNLPILLGFYQQYILPEVKPKATPLCVLRRNE